MLDTKVASECYNCYMERFCFLIIIFIITANVVLSIDLDTSVDDEIRKNYNSNQLVDELLPELPKILQQPREEAKPDTAEVISKQITPPRYRGIIKSGTKIPVVSETKISDTLRKGTKVTFHCKNQVYAKGAVIPAWSKFYGEVEESHSPQLSCNGGLVVLKVNSIVVNKNVTPLDAYITRADDKKIFFNNIKGKRTYWKTLWAKTGFGRNLFDRMLTLTAKLGKDGSTIILSPFPFCYGTVVLGLNTLTSPLFALFSKGGSVSIPAGTEFVIKVREDTGFYY